MKRTKLKKSRIAAFRNQCGRCDYCNQPIWEVDAESFASKYGLTLRQAKQLRLPPSEGQGTVHCIMFGCAQGA